MWERGFSCDITQVFGRSDSEFEMSPKSISRHSSVASNISGWVLTMAACWSRVRPLPETSIEGNFTKSKFFFNKVSSQYRHTWILCRYCFLSTIQFCIMYTSSSEPSVLKIICYINTHFETSSIPYLNRMKWCRESSSVYWLGKAFPHRTNAIYWQERKYSGIYNIQIKQKHLLII